MMDGLTLTASAKELQSAVSVRIERVLMPEPDEIHLLLKNGSRILISASAENGRIHFTSVKKTNPINAPMFCMLLRKWLTGGRIVKLEQINGDRIVEITVERQNEFMESTRVILAVEIMGRHSNIILLDENRVISDSIKRVGLNLSAARAILPGLEYESPPTPEKKNPKLSSRDDFLSALSLPGTLGKALSSAFYGLSPDMAQMLAESLSETSAERTESLTEDERERLADALYGFYNSGEIAPCLFLNENGTPVKLYPFVPNLPEKYIKRTASIGEGLDLLYEKRDTEERMRRLSLSLVAALKNAVSRRERKLVIYDEAISAESRFEEYRREGEAIVANIYRIESGQTEFTATMYDEYGEHEISVTLDPSLTPSENAQKRFRKYQKAKTARESAMKMRDDVEIELEYLRNALDQAQRATDPADLGEIRADVLALGYIRPAKEQRGIKRPGKGKKQEKRTESEPLRFRIEGHTIIIGKNSRQNERVTFKMGAPEDIWLHVQGMPGSHVILKLEPGEQDVSPEILGRAAQYAAYFSSARMSENVPVDYTRRKFVKKHPSGMPGMVNYTNQRTLFADPVAPEDK